jgi:cell division protein FtsB
VAPSASSAAVTGAGLGGIGTNERRMAKRARQPFRRLPQSSFRRWVALAVLAFVAFLYYQPLRTYLETRDALERRAAEVRALESQRHALEGRLAAQTSPAALIREARRLGYVKPGERLFIIKGISAWRRGQPGKEGEREVGATLGGDG